MDADRSQVDLNLDKARAAAGIHSSNRCTLCVCAAALHLIERTTSVV